MILALIGKVGVTIARLAQLTVEGSPGVGCYELGHFLVLVACKPLSQAAKVDRGHRARTPARTDEWILDLVLLFGKTDPAHVGARLN